MKKYYEIYNHLYDGNFNLGYFYKRAHKVTIGFVYDTEENVKELVKQLNEMRGFLTKFPNELSKCHDLSPNQKPDEDYIDYREIKISDFDTIRSFYEDFRTIFKNDKEENKNG